MPESSGRAFYSAKDAEHYRAVLKNGMSVIEEKRGLPGQDLAFDDLQEDIYLIHAYAYKNAAENEESLIAESNDVTVAVESGKTTFVSVALKARIKSEAGTDADSPADPAGVQTWADLAEAVANAAVEGTVYIGNTLTATSTITVTKKMTIKSLDGKKYTINRGEFSGSPVYKYLFSTEAEVSFGGDDEGQLVINGGGGEYASNSLIESKENLWIMKNCTLTNNYSSNDGGAITVSKNSGTCVIKGKITGNTTSGSGGAIYAKGSSGSIISVDVSGEISGNTARSNGGGVCGEFINLTMNSAYAKISGNKTENSSGGMGGGVYIKGAGSLFNLSSGEICNNSATSGNGARGGGIYMNAGTLTVTGGKISGNTATAASNPGHQVASANSGVTYSITGNATTSGPIDDEIIF